MIIGILGLSILASIMWETWWLIPFLVLGVEVCTGFAGTTLQWFISMGDE